VLILLTACAPSQDQIKLAADATLAAWPTATPYPTYTPQATYTAQATYSPAPTYTAAPTQTAVIMVVTETQTATPLFSATPDAAATQTVNPLITISPLRSEKGPGTYTVGFDIAPGVWHSTGRGEGCYWVKTNRGGEPTENYWGFAGGSVYLAPGDFEVQLDPGCGNWVFIGPP
jgi:hypothetical protein